MFRQIGAPEIILILAVVILLFGAKKLPDLARGSGRALRIFKAETKGLIDDDEDETPAAATPLEVRAPEAVAPQVQAEAETQAKTTD
ncbi:MAG: Sec-independent protein translocase subunit TatA [Marmoricola sp.]